MLVIPSKLAKQLGEVHGSVVDVVRLLRPLRPLRPLRLLRRCALACVSLTLSHQNISKKKGKKILLKFTFNVKYLHCNQLQDQIITWQARC